jgi:hypothetical protein
LSKIAARRRVGAAPLQKKPSLDERQRAAARADAEDTVVEEAAKLKSAAPHSPKKFHIDKRADAILATEGEDDDDLLTTRETANWLQVSEQWLAIGRHRGYGPSFTKCSTLVVRYRRGDVRAWLRERTFASTAEYAKKKTEAKP